MILKLLQYVLGLQWVLLWSAMAAYAALEQQIYPIPETEAEQVVIQWLHEEGYQLRRAALDNRGVMLHAHQNNRRWQIALWPHSPLATRIRAEYKVNGTVADVGRKQLWSVLDDHVKTIGNPAHGNQPKMPAPILPIAESVVCIYVGYPDKTLQISGFIIDRKGLIICTAHGLRDVHQPLTVTLRDGRQVQGWVVKIDKRYDLSLIDVKTELEAPIPLSKGRNLKVAEDGRLFNVVCSANAEGVIYTGSISGPPRTANHQLLWQVNMQIRPGSSGSPVFDQHGNLVAVVKGRYRGAEKVGFLIPYASLMNFMRDFSK